VRPPYKVLILCTGNSARSIIAERLLRDRGRGRFEAYSAGAAPTGAVNPLALWVLKDRYGLDAADARSKSWDEFRGVAFDFVITVCDNAREACPIWPGHPILAHWGSPDPAAAQGSEAERKWAFVQVASQVARRIDLLCALPDAQLRELQVQAIGKASGIEGGAAPGSIVPAEASGRALPQKRLDFFERYLSAWVLACMVVGVAAGQVFPSLTLRLSSLEFGHGSHVSIPIAVLIWLMVYPMMLKIDFGGLKGVILRPKGLAITLFVNWLVKPFGMAFLGWLFLRVLFGQVLGLIPEDAARSYTAGLIILAAAPCTAMVFVWSYLTDGDSAYTLAQVAINDLIMLVLFAPIVMFLVGVAGVTVPREVLFTSVVVFIVIPLVAGWLSRTALMRLRGRPWFEGAFLPVFKPVTILALLATLVLIFAFQSENILGKWPVVLLISVPIVIQVYFNSGLVYLLMRRFRVPHNVASPGALIGASNFFELAVAVALTLFGPTSGAALATVVGVLVEVPVMLSVCRACVRTKRWYELAL
jgi:ACR3 family arsenite transporter